MYKHYKKRPKIEAVDTILWGLIGAYIFYFSYVNFLLYPDGVFKIIILSVTFLLALGSLVIYEVGLKIIKDKSFSLTLVASYLLNPYIQKSNINGFNLIFLFNEFAVIGLYVAIILFIEKILALKKRNLDSRFFCIIILIVSVLVTYFYGILPGSMHPFTEVFK